ncbi:hypothetical protein NDU88_008304 [Pleurodeles waltl]|uniref:Uncharacterized protein n=1 Tax=Pleurodeles waltl TaxID=8319 RepID=A0AAV7VW74_PLEWA|nr:hypothetical protein NDU88_008304 [Pleurodeles waltl]
MALALWRLRRERRLARFPGQGRPRNHPRDPDIRVPSGTKREDGLQGGDEEDAEKPGREENGKDTEDKEKKADDGTRNGNSVVPTETADQERKGRNGDTLTDRHAPGGTWLTKIRHIPGALQGPVDFLSRFPDPSVLYQSRSWDGVCSRLSMNPAQDASEWRLPRGIRKEKDGLPGSLGNDDPGTALENLDIRVPSGTKREDGLQGGDEEDAEKPGREENGKDTEDKEKKADDGTRNGNSVVPTETADQERKGRNGDTLTDRHAPGGTWLKKVRSFLKDSILTNRESYSRRGEGRDGAGRGRAAAWREHGGDEEE